MIYGPNFNGKPIPDHVARMFKPRRRVRNTNDDGPPILIFSLVGVCQHWVEVKHMNMQADNGRRLFKYAANFTVDGEQWYAIYAH